MKWPHLITWFHILLKKRAVLWVWNGFAYFLILLFRMNFVSTSFSIHLAKMEFLENKHLMQAFLTLAESKIKLWIIKYGRRESVELMLHDYIVSSVIALLFIFEMLNSVLYHYLTNIFILISNMLLSSLSHVTFSFFDSVFSHLWRSSISSKITSHCSRPWNSLLRPLLKLTAQVRRWYVDSKYMSPDIVYWITGSSTYRRNLLAGVSCWFLNFAKSDTG